jgi:hypothetical protein
MQLVNGYPVHASQIGFPRNAEVQAAVSTYSGTTLIFHSGEFIMEMDECQFRPMTQYRHRKKYPQIPSDIKSVFRYTNGILYFFRGDNVYEYSEFNNTLVRAGKNNLGLFGIHCPTKYSSVLTGIANELKGLATRMEDALES